jgi:hypothetical protein
MLVPVCQTSSKDLLLLLKLRKNAVTADIQKMFLQIQLHPGDQPFQRTIWRNDAGQLAAHQLTGGTFGLASSSQSATRALSYLADFTHCAHNLAVASKSRFYVDDYLQSFDSVKKATSTIQGSVIVLPEKGCNLTKIKTLFPWAFAAEDSYGKDTTSEHQVEPSKNSRVTLGYG